MKRFIKTIFLFSQTNDAKMSIARKIQNRIIKILYSTFYPDCIFDPWPYTGLGNQELIVYLIVQKVIGINSKSKWPMHFTSKVILPENITVLGNSWRYFLLSPNCYYQAGNPIVIGKNTMWGPSVGFVAANHSKNNLLEWSTSKIGVEIGDNCWIGMQSVISQGTHISSRTIVGANSFVNKKFDEIGILIAGSPAYKIH